MILITALDSMLFAMHCRHYLGAFYSHIVIVFAGHRRIIQFALLSGGVCQYNFCLLDCLVKSDFLGNRSLKPTLSITVLEFTNPFQQKGEDLD